MRSDIAILATKSVALREIDRIMVIGDSTAHLQQENEEEVEVVTKKGNWESVAIRLNGESRYVFLPSFKVLCVALLCVALLSMGKILHSVFFQALELFQANALVKIR